MKRTLLYLAAISLMASCSAPKYSYNFDHYNYNAGKKKTSAEANVISNDGPQVIQPEMLTASTSKPEVLEVAPVAEVKAAPIKKTYAQMNKTERKELRTYLKAEVKNSIKAKKESIENVSATSAMDKDLKLAAIFGAVGVVGLILGGASSVFWAIGGIAMLIGVVFFVIWLTKQ